MRYCHFCPLKCKEKRSQKLQTKQTKEGGGFPCLWGPGVAWVLGGCPGTPPERRNRQPGACGAGTTAPPSPAPPGPALPRLPPLCSPPVQRCGASDARDLPRPPAARGMDKSLFTVPKASAASQSPPLEISCCNSRLLKSRCRCLLTTIVSMRLGLDLVESSVCFPVQLYRDCLRLADYISLKVSL